VRFWESLASRYRGDIWLSSSRLARKLINDLTYPPSAVGRSGSVG